MGSRLLWGPGGARRRPGDDRATAGSARYGRIAALSNAPLKPPLALFGATSLLALLITGTVETPIHWLLYHLLDQAAMLQIYAALALGPDAAAVLS